MSDGVLTVLKLCLLALLYLFLARVVWVVGAELRGGAAAAVAEPPSRTPRGRNRPWRLGYRDASGAGREIELEGEVTIGRAGGCGITLPNDTFVSQVHARVFERDGNAYVEDLGSTNGTRVNGETVSQPRKVRKGDRVQVGESVLEVLR